MGYYLYLLILRTTVTLIVNINLNEKKNKTLEAVGFEPERVDTWNRCSTCRPNIRHTKSPRCSLDSRNVHAHAYSYSVDVSHEYSYIHTWGVRNLCGKYNLVSGGSAPKNSGRGKPTLSSTMKQCVLKVTNAKFSLKQRPSSRFNMSKYRELPGGEIVFSEVSCGPLC